jgi:hypothetical protein
MESMAGNLQVGGSGRLAIAQLDVAVTTPAMRDSELKIIMIGRTLNWLPLRFAWIRGQESFGSLYFNPWRPYAGKGLTAAFDAVFSL